MPHSVCPFVCALMAVCSKTFVVHPRGGPIGRWSVLTYGVWYYLYWYGGKVVLDTICLSVRVFLSS